MRPRGLGCVRRTLARPARTLRQGGRWNGPVWGCTVFQGRAEGELSRTAGMLRAIPQGSSGAGPAGERLEKVPSPPSGNKGDRTGGGVVREWKRGRLSQRQGAESRGH